MLKPPPTLTDVAIPLEGGMAGTRSPHESATKHVSGQAVYIDDATESRGQLHAAVGLSPVTCGTLKSMDLTEVLAQPGVVAVLTLADVPGSTDIGPIFPGDPLLADGQIQFHGQPLFAVAADTYENARRAATFGHFDIVEQPALLDPRSALLQQRLVRPSHALQRPNSSGLDTASAMTGAAQILEGQLSVGGQEHYYLEGQISVASPTEDGGMFIRSSTQHPSEVQKLVAAVLDLPLGAITVETRRMGGGFGGKETQAAQWACIAALLASKTGREVKMRLPRSVDMMLTGKRHPFENHYRIGIDKHGGILAAEITLIADCGCSPDLSDAIVDRAMFHADNAYYLPASHIIGHRAFTNKVSNTAFRGFGGPQGMLIIERAMDDIARATNQDPLTVRKHNLYGPGRDTTPYYQTVEGDVLTKLIQQLEHSSDYWARRAAISQYNRCQTRFIRGLALTPVKFGISFTVQHLNQAGALMHIYQDGSVHINHGGTEMGQGLNTKVAQIVARVLNIDLSTIHITATRTDKVPNTSPTAASSGSDLNGQAAKAAAETLKARLTALLAETENVPTSAVNFAHNTVIVERADATVLCLSFAELAQKAYLARVSLSTTGYYKTPKIHYDRSKARGRPFYYFANGAAVAEVMVDTLTGEYQVTQVDILHDVGKSLNPALDIGQIEGGFIQGMGWLTTEDLRWDAQGRLQTLGAATYKIPAITDTPAIFNVALLESQSHSEAAVYHSKAVGEPPLMLAISVWSALRDAISSLSNYRRSPDLDTPATPEKVFWAMEAIRSHTTNTTSTVDKDGPQT